VRPREAAAAAKQKLDEAGKQWSELAPRRDQVDADLKRADEHNRKVIEAEAHMKRRAEAAETVAKLAKERDDLTKVIETIDARKAEILGAAKLPVDGLSIDDEGITLNGVPFVQASGAERLRVALGLAIAASPALGDVWIRDGALLDEESLELVEQARDRRRQARVAATSSASATKDPGDRDPIWQTAPTERGDGSERRCHCAPPRCERRSTRPGRAMANRTVTTYLVIERKRGWGGRSRVVRHAANKPSLKSGQCAVRVTIGIPDEAFEPVFVAPDPITFVVGQTLQATATKEQP
jgi:hypothetical protein